MKCWDWEKNGDLDPYKLIKGSRKKIWLNCDVCGHSFEAVVYHIALSGSFCPFCSKPPKRLCDDKNCRKCLKKSFTMQPRSKMWSLKNAMTPRQLLANSHKKFLFDCEKCGHEFLKSLDSVSRGGWCPYCANQRLCEEKDCKICFNKSFASHAKACQWSALNEKTARQVARNSNKHFWFQCDVCPHIFYVPPGRIVSTESWCGYCSNKLLCDDEDCQICFKKSFASHEFAESWSEKNEIKPRSVFASSNKRFWFFCKACKHEFNSHLYSVVAGSRCGYCSNKLLCNDEDCQVCFKKSFASHEFSKFWSGENTKCAREVFLFSNKSFWFNCEECSHSFESALYSVSQGSFCPFCSHRALCDNEDCIFCFNNSFSSNPKVEFWAKENQILPRSVFSNSGLSFWFNCVCGHQFSTTLDHISRGRWCPYCSIPTKKLCENENCKTCNDKSLNTHLCSSFWSTKNTKTPRQVLRGSHIKILFTCENGHEFSCAPFNIVAGKWCPLCFRRGERKLYEFLISSGFEVIKEKRFKWCKNKQPLPFDFLIKSLRVLIELDGHQHFRQVRNWIPHDEVQKRDLYKMRKANEYCYSVVRITWDMVYNDRGNWKEKLLKAIEDVEWHCCAFVCMNGEYDVYQGKV